MISYNGFRVGKSKNQNVCNRRGTLSKKRLFGITSKQLQISLYSEIGNAGVSNTDALGLDLFLFLIENLPALSLITHVGAMLFAHGPKIWPSDLEHKRGGA